MSTVEGAKQVLVCAIAVCHHHLIFVAFYLLIWNVSLVEVSSVQRL